MCVWDNHCQRSLSCLVFSFLLFFIVLFCSLYSSPVNIDFLFPLCVLWYVTCRVDSDWIRSTLNLTAIHTHNANSNSDSCSCSFSCSSSQTSICTLCQWSFLSPSTGEILFESPAAHTEDKRHHEVQYVLQCRELWLTS